jgi:hypothetical protein
VCTSGLVKRWHGNGRHKKCINFACMVRSGGNVWYSFRLNVNLVLEDHGGPMPPNARLVWEEKSARKQWQIPHIFSERRLLTTQIKEYGSPEVWVYFDNLLRTSRYSLHARCIVLGVLVKRNNMLLVLRGGTSMLTNHIYTNTSTSPIMIFWKFDSLTGIITRI